MLPSFPPTIPALVDGTVFRDCSTGAAGHTIGKVMFNTAITSYQEILTNPSYSRQIVTLAYPHIDNVGVNREDVEATKVHAAGLTIKDLPILVSNFRRKYTLSHYLEGEKVVATAGIDTRKLTRVLREEDAQNDYILAGEDNVQKAVDLSRLFPGLSDIDLARVASITESYGQTQTERAPGRGYGKREAPKCHVVAYDFGVKFNILRVLTERGYRVTVVPAQASTADMPAHNPDGVFLSNGPGDPEPCSYAVATTKEFLGRRLSTLDICLGHQIMGLAVGAKTPEMEAGHHGANHPVKDLQGDRVVITLQNHSFTMDPESLLANARVTHVLLFDGTLQGFELTDRPVFCFQSHPEASPGPHDITYLFDRFTAAMDAAEQ